MLQFVPLTLSIPIESKTSVHIVIKPTEDGETLKSITGTLDDATLTWSSSEIATMSSSFLGTGTFRERVSAHFPHCSNPEEILDMTASANNTRLGSLLHVFEAQFATTLVLQAFISSGQLSVPAKTTLPPYGIYTQNCISLWAQLARTWLLLNPPETKWPQQLLPFEEVWLPLMPMGPEIKTAVLILTEINTVLVATTQKNVYACQALRQDMLTWQRDVEAMFKQLQDRFLKTCHVNLTQTAKAEQAMETVAVQGIRALRGQTEVYADELVDIVLHRINGPLQKQIFQLLGNYSP